PGLSSHSLAEFAWSRTSVPTGRELREERNPQAADFRNLIVKWEQERKESSPSGTIEHLGAVRILLLNICYFFHFVSKSVETLSFFQIRASSNRARSFFSAAAYASLPSNSRNGGFRSCVNWTIARPVSRQGRGKTPKSSLLHDDTACCWLFSALLLRGAEKNRTHHGFNPGCHFFRGDAIGSLEPATCGSKNGPGSGGRRQ